MIFRNQIRQSSFIVRSVEYSKFTAETVNLSSVHALHCQRMHICNIYASALDACSSFDAYQIKI